MAGGEFRFGTASIYMRRTSADRAARYNSQPRYYMATDLDRVRQFFPDFRRFIVMASRKLGIEGYHMAEPPKSTEDKTPKSLFTGIVLFDTGVVLGEKIGHLLK